ncbi:fluoride efflux transporter CrcB [Brevibacillus sp. GCM10020057]|uniref:fluoride efflux transporter CrcB n=1 Tax=Brevibacillus sp. GCM10020057 TaxID=3317327 RepID=UPI003644291C
MVWLAGIGGVFGALVRFWLGKWMAKVAPDNFPYGTWTINVTGSFLLGLLAAWQRQHMLPDWAWLLLGTGFLGGYTTFSTFSFETIQMLQRQEVGKAAAYVTASVLVACLFAWAGMIVGE